MLVDDRRRDVRKFTGLIPNYFRKNVGMLCFGADWKSPVMWAHYAQKHTGVGLGFDVEDRLLNKVDYTDEKISTEFGTHIPRFGLSAQLLQRIMTTKARAWEYEHEYRALGALAIKDPATGRHYTDFGSQIQLKKLILGHRCEWTRGDARTLLGDVVVSVHVRKARPAFGRFEMVERKDFPPFTVRPKGN